jgi:hypothetical protein
VPAIDQLLNEDWDGFKSQAKLVNLMLHLAEVDHQATLATLTAEKYKGAARGPRGLHGTLRRAFWGRPGGTWCDLGQTPQVVDNQVNMGGRAAQNLLHGPGWTARPPAETPNPHTRWGSGAW